jgi:hypothetical protein
MAQQTAVKLLFNEFKTLSDTSRFAGDEQTANLIDFLCEREGAAIQMEKEQIIKAAADHCYPTCESARTYAEQYYNETYGTE